MALRTRRARVRRTDGSAGSGAQARVCDFFSQISLASVVVEMMVRPCEGRMTARVTNWRYGGVYSADALLLASPQVAADAVRVPRDVWSSAKSTTHSLTTPRPRCEFREIRSAIPTRVELAKFREIRTRGRVALRFRDASSRSRAPDVNFALKSAGRRKTAVRRSKWSACGEW